MNRRRVYATFLARMVFSTGKVAFPRRVAAFALMRLGSGLTGLGDAVLRPRRVHLLADPEHDGIEALVTRVVGVGGEVRVELKLADGREVWGQLSGEEAVLLELHEGQILGARLPAAVRPLPRAA